VQYVEFENSSKIRLVTDGDAGWRMLDNICQLKPGELVPGTRYELRRWVGEGGMGHVFEAVHVDIERAVALKVMKFPPEQKSGSPELFLREARACAKVESRFVVKVMDFGELPDGRPFFVMELLGRQTVHSALQNGPMPLERALPILRQCCKALAGIHEAGLVHRDIKPKNVALLQEDGRKDTVRVVDFGVAAPIRSTPRTCGTVAYMAPEQVIGTALDGRTDIYALGCMAYEMLSRRPPFTGDDYRKVLDAHVTQPPPPLTTLCPSLPAAIDAILLRCLEKDPDQRWASPHELEAALVELQISLGLITPWDDLPMPMVDEERRAQLSQSMPRLRRRAVWVVPAGLGMMLMLGTSMGLIIADRADATSVEVHDGDAAALGDGVDDARLEMLTNETRLAASKAYWVYPIGDDPQQATALHWIRVLETEPGPAAEQAKARASGLRAEIAETLVRLGDRYWGEEHGRSFALEYYAMALVFEPELPLADERNPMTQVQLADLIARVERGEFNTAELRAAKAMAILADDDEQRRRERFTALVEGGNWTLSLQATDQLTQLVGADRPRMAEPAPGVGEDGEVDEVGEEDTSTAEQSERQPSKAAALVARARAAAAKGDRAGARRAFNEAIEADSRCIDALSGLAELHFEAGEYSKALGHARGASRLRPSDGNLRILLGDCYLKTLRYTSARDAYEGAERLGHPQARDRLANLDALAQ
jgi:tetratricopeptide (TPR) repeat protein